MTTTQIIDRLSEVPYTAKQIAALLRFAKASMTSQGLADSMKLEFRESQNRIKMLTDKALLEPVQKGIPNTEYMLTKSGVELIQKLLRP